MKMKKILKIGEFILTLFVAFCISSCKNDDYEKFLGDWQIESMQKDGVYQQIALSDISFSIEDGKLWVSGCSGVNLFNGEIKIKKGKVDFGNLASTRMMGSPEEMEAERLFLETLSENSSISILSDDEKNDEISKNYGSSKILCIKNEEAKLELRFVKQN